jgi:ribonuclease P protein component
MQGKRLRTQHLEVRILASPRFHPRVGFVVPKYRRSAVDRNQLKRRLREIVRTSVLAVLPAVDVVIKARATAYTVPFSTLAEELVEVISNPGSLLR